MVTYFKYTRKQRRMAVTLLMNALLAFAMYLAASHYLPQQGDQAAAAEILAVADIVIWIVEVLLTSIALYFWIENKSIELWVTPTELHYFDPTFSDYGWTIPIKDIVEIDQFTDVQQKHLDTNVVLSSGERKALRYSNFSIDRQAFFDALKKANPNIKLPDSPYRYQVRKPRWALRWLARRK